MAESGKISRPPPKGWWKWPIGVVVAIGIIGSINRTADRDKAADGVTGTDYAEYLNDRNGVLGDEDDPTEAPPELPEIGYEVITAAFDRNEIAAERRFEDYAMRVTGPVKKIQSGLTGKATIWLGREDEFLGTMVNLDREHTDFAAKLVPGLPITLDCSGANEVMGTVNLKDCAPAR